MFPVVVALSWTIYNGVKRFRYGGSVVPAMLSASGIRIFTTNLRVLLHQSESTQYGEPGYYISYSCKKAIKVFCGVWVSCLVSLCYCTMLVDGVVAACPM